ncbi:hypothetical protein EPO33_02130 [Patescibacteria group bacterium]|nr:MAG: hypothetical protein EPO33_02130 [Patescibacteria group bacterium]
MELDPRLLRGEHEHVRTRIGLFQDEYKNTADPDRRDELQREMLQAARESAELVRRIEVPRLAELVRANGADALPARYAFEVSLPALRPGIVIALYTDGPRNDQGRVMTVGELRAEGDPLAACARRLAAQVRGMDFVRSERRRTLMERHGRERAQAIRDEMKAFLQEFNEYKNVRA